MKPSSGRSSLTATIWILVAIVVAVALIIGVKLANNGTKSGPTDGVASAALMEKITGLTPAIFAKVGKGTATKVPSAIDGGSPYTKDGKPAVLYIGAEYCPFCATERWPMVVALSRFGSFINLGTTSSSSTDNYPSTATFSFHGSTYTSKYLSFSAIEETTNQPNGKGGYTTLDTPSAEQQVLLNKYDAPPYVPAANQDSIPFIYFGGQFLMVGSNYDPSLLQGKSTDEIASALSDPSSPISKGVIGAANVITATLCKLTNGQPGNVCSAPAITSLQASLGKS